MPIWHGSKPFVVGTFKEDGVTVDEEYIIQPGEEFPARAWELLQENDSLEVPYRGEFDAEKNRKLVEKTAREVN